MERTIATVQKKERQRIRVSLAEPGGRSYCILRIVDAEDAAGALRHQRQRALY